VSFLEVMSLHALTYLYAKGSSPSVTSQFVRSLGAPCLCGADMSDPLPLGSGEADAPDPSSLGSGKAEAPILHLWG
jgi:hypothetical protein